MALMHQTTLIPSKLELLADWLPEQLWFEGDATNLERLGSYRFQDPAGEVGMEGLLITAGGEAVYHVPLTYRAEPLAGAEAFLVGTSEHGVLGTRWIYSAMGDPVYRAVLATTIAHGGAEAPEEVMQADGSTVARETFTHLRGSGSQGHAVPGFVTAEITDEDGLTYAFSGGATLAIKRVATRDGHGPQGSHVLEATWPGHETASIIAILHLGEAESDEVSA